MNGNGQVSPIPNGVASSTSISIAVAAGANHSLALKNDGTVVAWGDTANGATAVPAGLTGVVAIAAGANHSLARKSDGTVVAWGAANAGQTTVPAALNDVTAIAGGGDTSYAVRSIAPPPPPTKKDTKIHAPALLRLFSGGLLRLTIPFEATLRDADTGAPIAGKTITFRLGNNVACSAKTNSSGTATCQQSLVSLLGAVLSLGYSARFAGDDGYRGSFASGGLIG